MPWRYLIIWLALSLPAIKLFAQSIDSLVLETIDKSEDLRINENAPEKAVVLLQETLTNLEATKEVKRTSLIPLYHKLGVNFYYLGNSQKALPYASKALELRQELHGINHIDVVRSAFLRGAINTDMRFYDLAEQDLTQAVTSMEHLIDNNQSNDTIRLINIYDEFINLSSIVNNNDLALQYWEKSFSYYKRRPLFFKPNIADLYLDRGNIFFNQKKYHEAIGQFQKATSLFEQLSKEDNYFKSSLAAAYSNLALMRTSINQNNLAWKDYDVALNIWLEIAKNNTNSHIHQQIGNIYVNLMELCSKTPECTNVDDYYNKALTYNIKGWETESHPQVSLIYLERGEIAYERKAYDKAIKYNTKAIEVLHPSFSHEGQSPNINLANTELFDRISLLKALRQRALINTAFHEKSPDKQNYLEAALNNYISIDTLIVQIRQTYDATGAQLELIKQSYPIYEKALDASLKLYSKTNNQAHLEWAYYFGSINKASLLSENTKLEQAISSSSIPKELKEEEEELKREIFLIESELVENRIEKTVPVLREKLFQTRRKYQKLIDQFESNYTDYYTSKFSSESSLKLSNLQHGLIKGQLIIEYFLGSESIYVFTISNQDINFTVIPSVDLVNKQVNTYYQMLSGGQSSTASLKDKGKVIYDLLLGPSLSKADKNSSIKHLVIIPDGILLNLPFDLLCRTTSHNETEYVLEKYAVSYAYSNRLIWSPKTNVGNGFAGFGLEYDSLTLQHLNKYLGEEETTRSPNSRSLGKLKYSDDEVIEIAQLLKGDYWINKDATLETFLSNSKQYDILHIAAHGILNEAYPLNSAIVFTRQNDTTENFLRASEIYNLNIQANMVVISACNTANGKLYRGEGINSLARAFTYAGCPSLVASTWNASDKPTKDILVNFYKYLKDGESKSSALRRAKLDYLKIAPPAYRSPYYWGHLIVIGDDAQLTNYFSSNSSNWLIKYLILGILLFGGYALLRKIFFKKSNLLGNQS